jgi:hypothetical protein
VPIEGKQLEKIMSYLVCTLIVGAGATVVTDLWSIARRPLLGIPLPDYALVGRWFAHMAHGRFHHQSIAASPSARGELLIGWLAHYLIGIVFAGVLLGIWGHAWIRQPTIFPALTVGVVSVAAPLFLMQPGMGAGIAASRTPRPNAARFQSLITHVVFGVGLYLAGWVASFWYSP